MKNNTNKKNKKISVCDAAHLKLLAKTKDSTQIQFDFYINIEEASNEIKNEIIQHLIDNNFEFLGINIDIVNNYPLNDIWDLKKIKKFIKQ